MSIPESPNFGATLVAAKPLAVTVPTACRLIGVGNTKMWELIKLGRVKTTRVGRRRLVLYSSLEALIAPDAGAASWRSGRP
jgi:excisionase family DNA binding protein